MIAIDGWVCDDEPNRFAYMPSPNHWESARVDVEPDGSWTCNGPSDLSFTLPRRVREFLERTDRDTIPSPPAGDPRVGLVAGDEQ